VDFWETANSEMKGWLFFLFPVLAIPPLVPWLKIAIPASLGFSLHQPIAKIIVLVGALFFTIEADVAGLDKVDVAEEVSAIGSLSPAMFKLGIWVLAGIGALVARSSFTINKKHLGAYTDA
jgi:hypothetical protein